MSMRRLLRTFGMDPGRTIRALAAVPRFRADLRKFRAQTRAAASPFPITGLWPCLADRGGIGAAGHYFHQDLHVAQRIFAHNPRLHVDVGSRVDGFVAHVASFRPIVAMDIRPLQDPGHGNIRFIQADLMNLPAGFDNYCDSLSCLHANEHFGLGRYGDPIAADGHLRGLESMHRMLQTGGKFYYSVPIGPQRVEFNAHRVFCLKYLLALFAGRYTVDAFAYVDDAGRFHPDAELSDTSIETNCGCTYGCGIFEMTKRARAAQTPAGHPL